MKRTGNPPQERGARLYPEARGLTGLLACTLLASTVLAGEVRAQAEAPGVRVRPRPRPVMAPGGRISVSFTDMSVRGVLAVIAEYAKTDVLVTPGATGNVSVNIRSRTADEAIRLVAATAGLSVVRVGASYIVGPAAEIKKAAAEFGVQRVVPLRHLSAAEAVPLLNRVAPTVSVEAGKTALVLSGLAEDVEEAETALNRLDVAPPTPPVAPPPPVVNETDVKVVRFVDPVEVERVVREAFPNLRITRQERTLILTGPRVSLEAAGRAFLAMDVAPPPEPEAPAPPEERVITVYRLSYVNAERAEESLKKALPALNVTVAPEPTAPPPAVFEPLSLSFLSGSLNGGGGGAGGGGGFGGGGGIGGGGGFGGGGNGGQVEQQPLSRATRLVLVGTRSEVDAALKILEEADTPPPGVNIEAEVLEINRDSDRQLGINWDFSDLSATFTFERGNAVQFGRLLRGESSFRVSLQALMDQGKARFLARPNVSVIENEEANIFIGDIVRFPGSILVSPDVGTIQGTEATLAGIALLVRPRIHSDGSITLRVHPMVSTITSFEAGLPQTAAREADTTVRLRVGEALVIGGLQRSDDIFELRKVPGLGDIPLLGQFFRFRRQRKQNTEIVIIVRVRGVVNAPNPVQERLNER